MVAVAAYLRNDLFCLRFHLLNRLLSFGGMTVDPKYNVSKPGTSAECKSTLVMSSPSVVFFFLARVTIRSFFFIFSGFGSFSFWSFFNRSSWLVWVTRCHNFLRGGFYSGFSSRLLYFYFRG